jgi:hypothetical protein
LKRQPDDIVCLGGKDKISFLDLPHEIRIMIYKEFWKSETDRMHRNFEHDPLLPVSDSNSHLHVVPLFCLALLFTSRQVYKEAREVF